MSSLLRKAQRAKKVSRRKQHDRDFLFHAQLIYENGAQAFLQSVYLLPEFSGKRGNMARLTRDMVRFQYESGIAHPDRRSWRRK